MLAVSERSSPSLTLAANSRAATASHTQTRRKVALTTKDPTAGGQIQPVAEADTPATKASYVLKKVSVGIDDRIVTEAAAEEKKERIQAAKEADEEAARSRRCILSHVYKFKDFQCCNFGYKMFFYQL